MVLQHDSPQSILAVYDINYTNNFDILRRIDNMIAIDNCVAVDLLGQQCSGFYEKRPISSSGGYFQFVTFCAQSKGGRGVASMTARSKHGTSRIVPFLPEGSSVDVPAQLSQYVCTEFGIVNLRGLSGYERASALISIAHPDDREWLEKEARRKRSAGAEIPRLHAAGGGQTRVSLLRRAKKLQAAPGRRDLGLRLGSLSVRKISHSSTLCKKPGLRPGLFYPTAGCPSLS